MVPTEILTGIPFKDTLKPSYPLSHIGFIFKNVFLDNIMLGVFFGFFLLSSQLVGNNTYIAKLFLLFW